MSRRCWPKTTSSAQWFRDSIIGYGDVLIMAAPMLVIIIATANLGPQRGPKRIAALGRRRRRSLLPLACCFVSPSCTGEPATTIPGDAALRVAAIRASRRHADGCRRALSARSGEHRGDAASRNRSCRVRARDGRSEAAGPAGADRAALPVQHAGQRAPPLPEGSSRRAEACSTTSCAISRSRCRACGTAIDARARRRTGRGLPSGSADPHGTAAGVQHRHTRATPCARRTADDAVDAGRECDQARPESVAGWRADPHRGARRW